MVSESRQITGTRKGIIEMRTHEVDAGEWIGSIYDGRLIMLRT